MSDNSKCTVHILYAFVGYVVCVNSLRNVTVTMKLNVRYHWLIVFMKMWVLLIIQ